MHLLDLWEALAAKQPTWVFKPVVLVDREGFDGEILSVQEGGASVVFEVTFPERKELDTTTATEYLQSEGYRVVEDRITVGLMEAINRYIAAGEPLTLTAATALWDELTDPPA